MALTWKSKNEFNESNVTFGMLTTRARLKIIIFIVKRIKYI